MKIKLSVKTNNDEELIEYEGCMIDRSTFERIEHFNEKYSDKIIEEKDKPSIPKQDSKGRPINYGNNPTYVKLLRKEEYPTFLRSKSNMAYNAKMYSVFEKDWVDTPKLWQDYVYEGMFGIDYIYVDDITIKDFIKNPVRNEDV